MSSLRQREFTLECLEQRMLLSADGLIDDGIAQFDDQPTQASEIIVVNDPDTDTAAPAAADESLVDTTAPATTQPAETETIPATGTEANPPAGDDDLPASPSVTTAADISVMTLTSGNGPPAAGLTDDVDDGDTKEDLSAWDPPLGGFNYTATHADVPTRDAQYAALTALFTTGTSGAPVEMFGTIVKRPDGGVGTDYSLGELTIEGTFFFQRHEVGGVDQLAGGMPVFEVWFTSASGSLVVNGVTLELTLGSGGFLISGDLANVDTTGGLAGTANITAIDGLLGAGDDLFAFGTLTGGTLSLNTTGAAATATDVGTTDIDFTFDATEFLRLAGNVSIALGGDVGVTLAGAVVFEVADTNGATTGGQVLTVALNAGTATLTVTGVTVTASLTSTVQISASGVTASAAITGISISGGGTTTSGFTAGSFSLDTTTATTTATVSATVALNVSQGGIEAGLSGTFTFNRGLLGTDPIIRIGVAGATSTFTAGSTTLAITGIDGAFVIMNSGFAGKATVGGITLTGVTGFTFDLTSLLFEINTTDTEINDLVIPGTATTLNFTGADRKKFFRMQGGVELGIAISGIAATLDGTFYFEQFDPDGAGSANNVVKFAAIGANASFSAGDIEVGVTDVNGGFILDDGGIAGYVTAVDIDVTGLPEGVTVGGSSLYFAINTTGAAAAADFGGGVGFDYSEADELDFVSVGGTITLGLEAGGAAVAVSGSLAFYGGTVDGNEVVKVGLEGLTASITIGEITASITDIEGVVVILDEGVAGRIEFDELTIQGINNFTLSATGFAFEFNTTGLEIEEEITVGGVIQAIEYTAAENETNFFRGSGTASLAFTNGSFSTTLSGTFGFEQFTMPDLSSVVKFAFTAVNFEIAVGDAKLVVNDADGFFIFGENSSGIESYAGRLSISDAELEGVTGLTLSVSNFNLEVNTFGEEVEASITRPSLPDFELDFTADDRHDFIALGGVVDFTISLNGFSLTLTGGFYFEKSTLALNGGAPESIMKISVTEAAFDLNVDGTDLVSASGINGAFLLKGDGTAAGQLTIATFTLNVSGLTVTGGSIGVEFNNTGGAVSADIPKAGGGFVTIDYDEDIIRVGGTLGVDLALGGLTASLSGTFVFEKTDDFVKIGFKDITITITAGTVVFLIEDVDGAVIIYADDGLALGITVGEVSLTGIPGVSVSITDFFLEINNTGGAVTETVEFADGSEVELDYDNDVVRFGVSVQIKIGGTPSAPLLTLTALDVVVDTGATGSEHVFEAALLSGQLNIAALGTITVSASNLAVTAQGNLANLSVDDPFVVSVTFGGTFTNADGTSVTQTGPTAPAASGFQWPAWMPLKLKELTLIWDDVGANPEDFTIIVTAAVDIVVPGISFSGYVEDLEIDVGKLINGEFPIIGFSAAAVVIEGDLFGLEVSGGIVLGMVDLLEVDDPDSSDPDDILYEIIDNTDPDAPEADETIFYFGLAGSISIAGMAGAGFRIGVAEFGGEVVPLEAFISVDVPIIIEPFSGLTLGGFFGGIQFATTLERPAGQPDYDDVAVLKTITIDSIQNPTADVWNARLKAAALRIFVGDGTGAGAGSVWDQPMVITASVEVYSSYISKQALMGNLLVQFDTEGRLLLIGELTFGGGNLKLDAKFFIDFSNTSDIEMAFYASFGASAGPPPFEIWGELDIQVFDINGDILDSAPAEGEPLPTGRILIALSGGAQFNAGGAMTLKVEGTLTIEIDYRVPATTVTTLTFNARVGMVVPAGAPNPLGTDFGRLAGTVVLISSEVDGFDMYGAVSLEFEPASLAQYGLDVGAVAFVQINTTDDDQTVELIYFGSTDPVPVELGANSFKLFIQGDVAIFPPGGSPANALFTMNGFLILQIENDELTIVVDADMVVAPGGNTLLTLQVSGFMRVSADGVAARLLVAADPVFPPSAGIELDAALTLIVNTTGEEVSYTIPDWFYTVTEVSPGVFEYEDTGGNVHDAPETITIPKSPPQLGADLSVPADPNADGGFYFVVGIDGMLEVASAGLVLDGNFFMLITADEVQLQIDATLELGDPTLFTFDASGYMVISDEGVAARLDLSFALGSGLPGGLSVDADLALVVNTTGEIVSYLVEDGDDDGSDPDVITIPEGAPALGTDLTTMAAGGTAGDYFVVQLDGTVSLESIGLQLDGFFFLLVDGSEVQIAIDATLEIGAPEPFLTFEATGYMKISEEGVAARLDVSLVGNLPPDSGLEFTADFLFVLNTTGEDVTYTIPDGDTYTIARSAPVMPSATGGLSDLNLDTPADPDSTADYLIVAAAGSLSATAAGTTLVFEGFFFILVTEEVVQLRLTASVEFGDVGELAVSGFLEISDEGAAGVLEITAGLDLADYGISISGFFLLAFNSYDDEYELPDAVAADFDLPEGSTLDAGLLRIEIAGEATIGSVLTLEGRFFFETSDAGVTTIEVDATLDLIDILILRVDGTLILIEDEGAVGSLVAEFTVGGNKLADLGLNLQAGFTIVVKVNTTDAAQEDPGVTQPTDGSPLIMIDAETVEVDISGSINLLDAFTFNGHFYFKQSGADLLIRFDATLSIVVGTFAVAGEFISNDDGYTAKLTLQLQSSSTLSSLGFNLTGSFYLLINGTDGNHTFTGLPNPHDTNSTTAETLGAGGVMIYVKGGLTLLDTLVVQGSFKLTYQPGFIEIYIDAKLDLAGLVEISVQGFAGIYSDGIVIALDVYAEFGLPPVFEATGNLEFRLNTSNTARTVTGFGTIAADYFRISVPNLTLKLLSGIMTMTGSLYFEYSAGTFTLQVTASLNFFGLGSVNITGFFNSAGSWALTFTGEILIGVEGFFGIGGGLTFNIAGNADGVTALSGSINARAWIIGIGFDVTVGIQWDGPTLGNTGRLRASISLTIDFWLFSVTYRGNFDLGYIKSTQTYQAGIAGNSQLFPPTGTNFASAGGGELIVNVGNLTLRDARNYSSSETDEQVMVRQVGAAVDGKATIEVEIFGLKKRYTDVSSVRIETGDGEDYVYISGNVTIPVYVDLGPGNDVADVEANSTNNDIQIRGGTGNDVITGGGGNDRIWGDAGDDIIKGGGGNDTIHGGDGHDVLMGETGVDTITGGTGNDIFAWTVGDGADAAFNGGDGIDTLSLIGSSGADTFTLGASGFNFTVTANGTTIATDGATSAASTFGIESFGADLLGGGDSFTLNHLGSSTLKDLDIQLGADSSADSITINGNNSAADVFRISSTTDNPATASVVESNTVTIARFATSTSTTSNLNVRLYQGAYPADMLTVNGNGGNDLIDAMNVNLTSAGSRVALTLNGGAGGDTLIGGSYNDNLDGGSGNDFLTGGPGLDTFADASGNDELIEHQDVHFTLNGWSLTAGGVTETLPAVFEHIRLSGGNGNNDFTLSNLATIVTLNGGEGSDDYIVNLKGSGISTLNITDSGTGVGFSNTNTLRVNGTTGDDTMQLRVGSLVVGEPPYASQRETINFAGISSFVISGGNGADTFYIDETTVAGEILGDAGADSFYIGRMIAEEDEPEPSGINTIDTTRGWLAYGNRSDLAVRGGAGGDYFEVNHNQAELHLFGDDGDDLFLLRTFLHEGSALSNVSGGAGLNTINYVQNGPVKIDGGAGFDRIILEGTEADDVFIITDKDIFGGGRQIEFVNIEGIVILGGAGDDTVYVLGNGLPLEIQGGSGNDTVHIGGQAPDYVFDAPEVIIDPEPIVTYVPVFSDPISITFTVPGFLTVNGSFPFFHWIPATTYTFIFPPVFLGFEEVINDPPPYTVNPPPITYRFQEVVDFNGVVNGVEVYNATTATPVDPDNPGGVTPTYKNLGTINAPVRVTGGEGQADSLEVHLQGTTGNLTGTLRDVAEIDTAGIETGSTIGQIFGLGLPTSFTSQGREFLGGITFSTTEQASFDLGSGNDTFNVEATHGLTALTINGNAGADTFNLKGNTATLTANGGDGDDRFYLGSNGVASGVLDNLEGGIIINGGAGADTLNLDDRLDGGVNALTLTGSTISGLGLGGSVTYGGVESLAIHFGSGADIANIQGTSIPTTLNLNNGNDAFYASSTAAVTAATRASTTSLGGHLGNILASLTINAGAGRHLGMVSDASSGLANGTSANPAIITDTTLTGFAPAAITYTVSGGGNFDDALTVWSGSALDYLRIDSTLAVGTTILDAGAGSDEILVRTISGPTTVRGGSNNDTVRVSTQATGTNGTLNAIGALLTIDGGTGFNQLFLDELGDPAANTGTLTGTRITGLGMAGNDPAKGIAYAAFNHLELNLGSGGDTFNLTDTHAGTTLVDAGTGDDTVNVAAVSGVTTIRGNAGTDTINVNPAHVTGTNPIGALLNLDGQDGADSYHLKLTGAGTSVINVLDTGATGVDNLLINDTPGADTFLFRRDFLVLLQYLGGAQLASHERINYSAAIDGMLTVTSVGGANAFHFDDTTTEVTINGSADGDTFQIGQVFGDSFVGEGFTVGDLLDTTRGQLSPGVSRELTVNGGAGEDTFSVFHNRALLNLNGGAGDDVFIIRSFALAGSAEDAESYDPDRGATNVSTGGGVNHVSYALNAPVTIAAGTGFDTVVVVATEFSDSIIITPDGVFGAGIFVEFTNIQELIVYAAEGNDQIWVLGTPVGASVRVVGGLGSDTVHLGGSPDDIEVTEYDANGVVTGSRIESFAPVTDFTDFHGPLLIDGGIGDGVPPLEPGVGLPGEITSPLPAVTNPNINVIEEDQVDLMFAHNTGTAGGDVGVLTADRLHGLGLQPDVTIGGVGFPAGVRYTELEEVIIHLGSGNDTFTIESTHTGRTLIEGRGGDDLINVRTVSGHTTVRGNDGDDVINVGTLVPATGGDLTSLAALLTIDGGAGLDVANLDHRGDTDGSTGWLTSSTLTGLEMTSAPALVNDLVTVRINATGGTFSLGHDGSSVVLDWDATETEVTAALWTLLGNRNAAALRFGDTIHLNFQGVLEAQAVTLAVDGSALTHTSGPASVEVTHRTDGVNYYDVDTLNLDLGSAADVLNIRSTQAGTVTNLNSHDGDDRIYVSSAADLTTSTDTDFLLGHLDLIAGTLNISAGTGRNLLMVSDEAATAADGSLGTPVLLTSSLIRGLAPADITYQAAPTGDFTQGITVWTGSGADLIDVTSTDHRVGVRTTTTLNTGAGADQVTVSLSAASDGFFVLNTQAGADLVDATASSLPLVIFGGEGSDTLRGGSGADLIFGDNGRVHYLDGATPAAILGGGGPGDSTDGIIRDDLLLFTVDPLVGAGDFLYGNDGADIILGGSGADTIEAGEDDNVVAGDHAEIIITAGLPVSVDSLHTGGGNDTITTGAGRDLIVGGTGNDAITAGAGDNVILGDHGTILLSGDIVTSVATVVNADGGVDTITTLGGRDFILGGEAGDIIHAGEGNNAVAGDHGAFTITSPTAFSFVPASPTVGGDDSITTGTGADTIIGGLGADGITAGDGRNVIFGDHGTVTRDAATGDITATSTAESTGGIDTITTGAGADVILGAEGADTINAGDGRNVVFGDHGTVVWTGVHLASAVTTFVNVGTVDTVTTGAGDDLIFGGEGSDSLTAGDGTNIVFGDTGTAVFNGLMVVSLTATSDSGAADEITTGADDDYVLGGRGGDMVITGSGVDVVIGDQGVITFTSGLATTLTNTPDAHDGADDISTGAGDDVVLGGGAGDMINAGHDNNTVVGDFAAVIRANFGSGLVTILLTTLFDGQGGDDQIVTGDTTTLDSYELIAGGHGSDVITAGNRFKIVLGDAGEIALPGGVFDYMVSAATSTGADIITAGQGNHYIIGGLGEDTIGLVGGVNVLIGDQGRIEAAGFALESVTTSDAGLGANDTITSGNGVHYILGGDGDDIISVAPASGFARVFGDHGSMTRVGISEQRVWTYVSHDFVIGGADTITTSGPADFIFGGFGADTINAGAGNNVVFGDNGELIETFYGLELVHTLAPTEGAADFIGTGEDDDIVLGGAGADVIGAGAGRNLIFGDHGAFVFANGDLRSATSTDFVHGGDDDIDSGSGEDVILGGFGTDTINAGDGDNVVFGDHGQVIMTAVGLDFVHTLAPTEGAADTITAGSGNDVILGGAGADMIDAGAGRNLIFGDHGVFDFTAGDLRSATSTDHTDGGDDVIDSGSGDDLIVGGIGTDIINAGDGDNVVLGDHGDYVLANGVHIEARTVQPAIGSDDSITTGTGHDVILGGLGADTIVAGDGNNIILGDHSELHWVVGILARMFSTDFTAGGFDTIFSGSGADMIIAGPGDDEVDGGHGDNIVFGDNGSIEWTAGLIDLASTVATSVGGLDQVTTGSGDDFIFGGTGADIIAAGDGDNLIFGDNGEAGFINGIRARFATTAQADADNDTITSGSGDDVILAGAGVDVVAAGDGDNTVFADEGELSYDANGILEVAFSLTSTEGGADTVTSGEGNDIIFGGTDLDVIDAGNGNNLVFGDNGRAEWLAGVPVYFGSFDPDSAHDDTITTGSGDDVILAGAGSDVIEAGDGDNTVFADEGELTYDAAGLLAHALSLATSEGDDDEITTGSGNDFIFGGTGDDVISAGHGDNLIFGDNGEATWLDGIRAHYLTFAPEDAGDDTITSGSGHDVVLAGAGADLIDAGDGNNLVFGDEGEITYDTAGVIVQADSITPDAGADDTITTGSGNDTIVGGTGLDLISAGDGDNVIFGDNGELGYSGGLAALFQTITPANSAADTVLSGSGRDIILGGDGADTINAGDGDNLVLGDEGVITFTAGVVQLVASEAFAEGQADVITTGSGHDIIIGSHGADLIDAGDGNNVVVGDSALLTLPGGFLRQLEALAPTIGASDVITTGGGNDVIMAGFGDDIIEAGEGDNIAIGDHATVTFAGNQFETLTPTTPDIGGADTIRTGAGADRIVGGTGSDWIDAGDGHNVVVGDHAVILQPFGILGTVESVAPADGDAELIFTGSGNDLIIGGTGGDTIHAGAGNDLVFGDHALVTGTVDLGLLPLALAVKPFTFTATHTQNFDTDGRVLGGDDVVFAGAGDDIVFGQQGDDILFGGEGNDDLIGGHNVSLGQDGDDVLDGGAGFDVIAGDNAAVLRTGTNISPRAHVLAGTAMFDDRGTLLDLDDPQAWPTNVPERAINLLDHALDTATGLFGADQLVGGAGNDVLFGQLDDDFMHGDAILPVVVAAAGTIDRTAVRATAAALFTTDFWVGADSDGDDYIEGNGGDDLIFGGLGQDDIVGGSSALFGLTDRSMRPDGADTLYGGNGTAAGFEDLGDATINGRARDADVIMGDNANIFRLVGLNGVSIGAFLTFSYDTAGTIQIIVRAFDLLDYTVPESPEDIGDLDTIYGEAGDDTIHGQVGDDVLLGNGNDDNLYGGQGDDLIYGGGGDDAISHSDELKPAPSGSGDTPGAGEAPGAAEDNSNNPLGVLLPVPSNIPAALLVVPETDAAEAVYFASFFIGYSNSSPLIGSGGDPVFPDGGSEWRIFESGIFPSTRFGAPSVTYMPPPSQDFGEMLAPPADSTVPPPAPESLPAAQEEGDQEKLPDDEMPPPEPTIEEEEPAETPPPDNAQDGAP